MIQIAYNAVDARILDLEKVPKAALLEVHRVLSYQVEGSEHMAGFKSGTWDGKSSFFSYSKGHFPAGFVNLVTRALKKLGHEVRHVNKPLPPPLGTAYPVVDEFGYQERYDYQPNTVLRLLQLGKMVAHVATGGGKSRICRIAYRWINRPTLFLTTRAILLHQMKDVVEGMGEEVAVLGDGDWGIPYTKADGSAGRRITKFCCGMVQTLSQKLEVKTVQGEFDAAEQRRQTALAKKIGTLRTKLKAEGVLPHLIGQRAQELIDRTTATFPDPKVEKEQLRLKVEAHNRVREGTLEFLKRFELVIAEEAHEISGDGFYTVMAAMPNAHYRLALTATPFMKDDEAANMRLMASCGSVGIRVPEQLLIERGILAKPYFKFIKLPEEHKPKKLYQSTPWATAYPVGIVENDYRNKIFCAEMLRAIRYGMNGIALVTHTAHGNIVKAILEKAGARVEFIQGLDNQKERQRQLKALAAGEIDVLIGTSILDVGVDVPGVGFIALMGGGKAEVATRQRIGRGLREKKNGMPNVAFIFDAYDEHNNTLRMHSGERQAIIKDTPGFAEGIVRDFDYAALGFTRKSANQDRIARAA